MKTSRFYPIFSFFLVFLAFAFETQAQEAVTGKGEPVSQTRNISGFTKISLEISGDLYISQGPFSCEISAQQNILDVLTTEVKQGELILTFKEKTWIRNSSPVKITISLPALDGITVNGSGNVVARSNFASKQLELIINGSGDLKMMQVTADKLNVEVNGSGNISGLSGSAGSADVEINGSGDFDGLSLTVQEVKASISGSGDISVGVSNSLDADVVGSGNVKYKGNPSTVHKDVTGSGSVDRL